MMPNRLKEIWSAGGFAVNGWLHIPSGWSAEVMSHQGFDSVTVDLQHGMMGFETAVPMLQSLSDKVVPLVRVPWNEPGIIMKLLDSGADGVICPMINSRAECEQFVGACRYFPDGYRSLGPTRAALRHGATYAANANRHVITMGMIETAQAVERIDDIVSVPGLDAIYVGPGDLSLTLGSTSRVDNGDPDYLAVLDTIMSACRAHGVVAGIHCNSPAYARQTIARGFQFVTIMTDTMLLGTKAKEMVTAVRGETSEAGQERPSSAY